MSNLERNNSAHGKTIFKQTFKFTKDVRPEQRISPDGFLIRDCGCVMRFLPSLDSKLDKIKLPPTTMIKSQNRNNNSNAHYYKSSNRTKMNNRKNIDRNMNSEKYECQKSCIIQHNTLYQSTFWMEPRVIPVKYTTEVNFNLESPIRRFTEKIDLQMKLVPCPYIQQIGTTSRFKTSIETRIQSEFILPLETTI